MQTIVNIKLLFNDYSDFVSRQAVIHNVSLQGVGGTTGAACRTKRKHLPLIHIWKLLWLQIPPQESK